MTTEPLRTPLTLADGTRIKQGERVGVLHLNNRQVLRLHRRSAPSGQVGFAFRRHLYTSLNALAAAATKPGPLADVRVFCAFTILHERLRRLGFQVELGDLGSVAVGAYQRALLASLHPDGRRRLTRSTRRRARRVWLAREALLANWHDHEQSVFREESSR